MKRFILMLVIIVFFFMLLVSCAKNENTITIDVPMGVDVKKMEKIINEAIHKALQENIDITLNSDPPTYIYISGSGRRDTILGI